MVPPKRETKMEAILLLILVVAFCTAASVVLWD
jgi:hypothetical protein